MTFQGKRALVTGGTRGIGKAIAERLVAGGAAVTVWGRPEAERGRVDMDLAAKQVGPVDILVNNAGTFGPVKSILEYGDDDLLDVLDVNLIMQVRMARHFVPDMVKRCHGRVINMASVVAKDVNPMAPAYSMAKAGVVAFTRCLGRELAKTGVTVNCVAPAAVNTDLFKDTPPAQVQAMLAKVPMGRFITVDEVADAVCWLASDAASGVTGACISVDGGRSQY